MTEPSTQEQTTTQEQATAQEEQTTTEQTQGNVEVDNSVGDPPVAVHQNALLT